MEKKAELRYIRNARVGLEWAKRGDSGGREDWQITVRTFPLGGGSQAWVLGKRTGPECYEGMKWVMAREN